VKLLFTLSGKSWNDFYRWMLELQERNTTLESILREPRQKTGRGLFAWWLGEYHCLFMQEFGLNPQQTVLDFGCGYGRSAIPLIKYLDPGKYIGTELSEKRLSLATEWVKREGLQHCEPTFIATTDNTMSFLQDGSVDAIWTLSVFTHMPEKEMHQVLGAFWRVLKESGVVYFHYNSPTNSKIVHKATVKDFYWEDAFIEKTVSSHGFTFKRVENWVDDLDKKIGMRSNMLRLTKYNV
jgi:cyclopropane fatty-acyl-phospholipid synthase-like methyltransferase